MLRPRDKLIASDIDVYKPSLNLISISNPFQPEHWPALRSALPLPVAEVYPSQQIVCILDSCLGVYLAVPLDWFVGGRLSVWRSKPSVLGTTSVALLELSLG